MTQTQTLQVELGPRAYPIKIGHGLLAQLPDLLKPLLARPKLAIVTDSNIAPLYGEKLQKTLQKAGIEADLFVVKAGESAKSFAVLERLSEDLLAAKIERDDVVLALGGGVVGDLTGFAAAILRRGCRFVQVPTSLLAQVDSSVGGKTGINSPLGKNLIGAFYQPSLVVIDPDVLTTLPPRHLRAGYAEIIKYGLINDVGFFNWLEENGTRLLAGDASATIHAIKTSCAAKAAIVARDERESGERALLNLGHSFGHALEALTGFGERLYHGEAVALGSALAFRFSAALGLCASDEAARVISHFATVGLPTNIMAIDPEGSITAEAMLGAMMQDKKMHGGHLTLILARAIGDSFMDHDVDMTALKEFLLKETTR
jgi:3-dehydroquinate synthase